MVIATILRWDYKPTNITGHHPCDVPPNKTILYLFVGGISFLHYTSIHDSTIMWFYILYFPFRLFNYYYHYIG